ncbi:MAG TPA: cytochrome c oxidase subunit 3 [Flavobacterium sp.]|jgi:cytochrome c oxidase subunit III|nr:cytochrome c oxidase subunit 3 [Flavobacterium sp.]HQV34812.1 cytochrome c oxidase subunit 3 [Flavobacterium sp.]HQX03320.1 cytochrome c oxidase subunit 3 [Flavobacterium sp.]HRZ31848.1 cytochrome c oxidase subunit 3 [Flavobacterium sp.]HRZ74493.1 cytochrome c oxidase subunit 3 [Flavobacterium sp.]
MEMTSQEHLERKGQSYKLLLWFAMISMVMMFAGLTSAYVVSSSRKDWLKDFEMPAAFIISTLVIILSSITFHLAGKSIKANNRSVTTIWLLSTLGLGILFVVFQFLGFNQIIQNGYFFTGSESNVTTSFLYIVVILHLAHLFGGLIALLIIIYNHFKQKYNSTQTLGIELGAMFWHFLDILWILLFLFFYFYE